MAVVPILSGIMINNTKKLLSLVIMLIGLAVLVRTVIVGGGVSLTAGIVVGVAFTAYGAVRLYYTREKS